MSLRAICCVCGTLFGLVAIAAMGLAHMSSQATKREEWKAIAAEKRAAEEPGDELPDPYELGLEHGRAGVEASANPYNDVRSRIRWLDGCLDGHRESLPPDI